MNMKIKELNKILRTQARELGLCDEWYDGWEKNESIEELLEKYLKGIDFCIKHDYPNIDFVRAHFPKEELRKKGIFLDDNVDGKNISKAVLLGDSTGVILYNGFASCDLYLRHQSEMVVLATDSSKVFIETYENCKLNVIADKFSKVFIYDHGGDITYQGNVIVRNKKAGT